MSDFCQSLDILLRALFFNYSNVLHFLHDGLENSISEGDDDNLSIRLLHLDSPHNSPMTKLLLDSIFTHIEDIMISIVMC